MYLTIAKTNYTHEVVIKKSRFITNLARVKDEDEARAFIEQIRKTHYHANHNVFAYVLGDGDQIQRMSDDGEPSGTAGVPILEVLKKNQIHDVVAVVTRYFGGIKLGAGGLIRAYAGSPAEALSAVGFVQLVPQKELHISLSYNTLDKVQYWLEQNNYPAPAITYTDQVELLLPVDEANLVQLQETLTDLTNGQINFKVGRQVLAEVPYIDE